MFYLYEHFAAVGLAQLYGQAQLGGKVGDGQRRPLHQVRSGGEPARRQLEQYQ
jgi:hypothetical protein